VHKDSFPIVYVTKAVLSVLYEEIITVYCDNDRDHVFKLRGGKFRVRECFDPGDTHTVTTVL
jgi:hypothetical protein